MKVISRRINTAIFHLSVRDYENALIQISIAIDATAKKKWPKEKVGYRIRTFLKEYESFIYKMASSGGFLVSKGATALIGGRELPEIIYKLVRCTLQHGDELGDYITILENTNKIGVENGKIIINTGHIYGLLLAVVVDSTNALESCDSNPEIKLNSVSLNINELWGNINKFQELTGLTVY